MTLRLLHNIGTIVSGSLDAPKIDADSILIDGTQIAAIGGYDDIRPDGGAEHWDLRGTTVIPGLIDAHSHPVLGNYTPRQRTIGWTEGYLNGGVTTLISAGETHWPGRVRTGPAAKANTIAAHYSYRDFRPDGIKVIGGALMLDAGLTERDFDDMHEVGVRLLGEVGLGSIRDVDELKTLIGYARARGWTVPLHLGGASVPGSRVVDAELAIALQPDVASHANGGPTARSLAEVERVIDETNAAIEVVQAGNIKALVDIVRLLLETQQISRLQFGTDTPSGTGIVPLGMLRTVAYAVALGGVDPYIALACATGSTAARYGLPGGTISVGAPADLAVLDAPLGGQGSTAVDALVYGDCPAVSAVFVDGSPLVVGSRVSPPPVTAVGPGR